MTTNRRAAGRNFERWCAAWLEYDGWSVHLCGRKAMMIGPGKLITAGNDILGADLVAVKPGQLTLFVQATMDSATGKRLDEIKKYAWDLNHQRVELWQKKPDGAVVIQRWESNPD
jgi:hypothetical protein